MDVFKHSAVLEIQSAVFICQKVISDNAYFASVGNGYLDFIFGSIDSYDVEGNEFFTVVEFEFREIDIIERNIDLTLNFLHKIDLSQRDSSVRHPYFRKISKYDVVQLISSISVHKASESYFDQKQILRFLKRTDEELNYFDVLIIGGQEDSKNRFVFPELAIDNALVFRTYDVPDEDTTVIRMSCQRARLGGRADAKNGLSSEQLPQGESIRSQDYMVKGRNPLLIIYFIDPDNSNLSDEEMYTGASSKSENVKVRRELKTRRYNYLVGYAIGFPHKDNAVSESILWFYLILKAVPHILINFF